MKYRHLTYTDRLVIEKMYNSGASYRMIAEKIGKSVSSVHAEVKRGLYDHLDKTWNFVKKYSADIAQADAEIKATSKGVSVALGKNYDYAYEVASRIKKGESPDSIVGDKRNKNEWTVSTVTLYRYIDQGFIPGISNKDLRVKGKVKRKYNKVRASKAPVGMSIEQRPEIVSSRTDFGHWEMDSVVGKSKGKNQTVLALTERKTRYEIVIKMPDKTAGSVVSALKKLTAHNPVLFKSITVDNGSEFSDYNGIRAATKAEVYYCHPYCSSERGSNENANKLIRRFLPKGISFHDVTQNDCDQISFYINSMHRKILSYKTAAELYAYEMEQLNRTSNL